MHPQLRRLLLRLGAGRRRGQPEDPDDNETLMHVIRVGKGCQYLARAAGLGEKTADLMLHAAPFHDIGKLGIARNILLKPGQLDPDERDVIETHVEIGAGLIEGINDPSHSMARSIMLTHHERWDGSGYPQGLKGENIPIEGRITALCDVFDTLSSERPYQRAWSPDDAAAYIGAHAGTHFDPKLARLFEDNLVDLIAIQARFHEDPARECRIVMEELA